MSNKLFVIILIIVMSAFFSCSTSSTHDNRSKASYPKKQETEKESLIKVNKYLVNIENTDIANYIRRHNLDVVKTGSGLEYQITKHGNGKKAKIGKIATINYKIKLITGDVIYSSEQSGKPLQFKIGHGGVESGLEEAILNMKVGDNAIIIIPSHLAHGLLGDNKKIPLRSTLIYEIEFTNLN